jgi:ferrous iron transport protein A
MIPLADVPLGHAATVIQLTGSPALLQRLSEFGLFEGETVELVAVAPLGDPLELRIGNTRLSLRRNEATGILVRPHA